MAWKVKPCPKCKSTRKIVRIDQYDAMACRNCLIWTESGCGQKDCDYCSKRPPTPNGVNWDDPWNTNYGQ